MGFEKVCSVRVQRTLKMKGDFNRFDRKKNQEQSKWNEIGIGLIF